MKYTAVTPRTKDGTGWVFPTPRPNASDKGYRDRISKSFSRIVKAAGLDPARITPHNLRHTAVSKLVRSGVDLVTVQAISGHKSMQMVLRYAKNLAPHIDRAASTLARAMPALPEHSADTVTHDLHKPRLHVIRGGRQKIRKA
jgi:integrase